MESGFQWGFHSQPRLSLGGGKSHLVSVLQVLRVAYGLQDPQEKPVFNLAGESAACDAQKPGHSQTEGLMPFFFFS